MKNADKINQLFGLRRQLYAILPKFVAQRRRIMSKQKVIICQNLNEDLDTAIQNCAHDKLFILVDKHTRELCLPLISGFDCLKNAHIITIAPEDIHKNLETLAYVWKELGDQGATRHSLMINLGGYGH